MRAVKDTMGDRDIEPGDRRKVILRELDVHGGSPVKTARALGMSITALQWWITRENLRGEAKRARDRWERMFSLCGNDED